jgi:WD40 repeat protein
MQNAECRMQNGAAEAAAGSLRRGDLGPGAFGESALPVLFGGYELLGEIGRGGMGVVYKARQIALNRPVALKMLLHGRFADAAFVDRFHLEAEAAALLDHPNIVPIYEVGQHGGQPYYSMKLIEGHSLAQEIAEGRWKVADGTGGADKAAVRRRQSAIATLVAKLARAVAFAHQHGVLHRDIKPHNILLDAGGEPHLADFGLAKLLDQESGLTLSAAVIGSPGFMAPEQAAGKTKQVTTAADVYGLGAVLYALLTGKAVFHADTPLETLRQVVDQEPVKPRASNPAVAPDLETICLKCLQKEPAKRYASAQALAEDLERWLRAEPIQARRTTAIERAWLWCRRQPVRASLVGALILVFVLGLAGVLWQWRRAQAGELFARQNAYAADMNLVQTALEKGNLGEALAGLDRNRPATGQKDLRGWEWRYFWQRCRSDERSLLCKYRKPVGALTFSADGKWLALRTEGGAVTLWDAVSRSKLAELPGAGNPRALAFSPQGDFLAYGNVETNGTPITSLYSIAEPRELARFPHSAPVAYCSFSPDGNLLAAWSEDGMVSLRQIRPQTILTNFQTAKPQLPHGRILFSPTGQFVAVGQQDAILLWEWATGKQRSIPVPKIGDAVTALAFSPDGRLLAAACNRIQLWDVSKVWSVPIDSQVPILRQSVQLPSWITDLAFSPDGRTLATAESDPRLGLWEVNTLTEIRRFQGNTHSVWAVAFSPDGKDLVSGAQDGSVRYWDPAVEAVAPSPAVLPIPVWCPGFAFAPDSKQFIALDNRDGSASRWSISPLRLIEPLPFLATNNSAVKWSPDGRTLAVGDRSGTLRIWDYATRLIITNFLNEGTDIATLKFTGGGRTLFCGTMSSSGHRAARFWDTRTWCEVRLPPDWPVNNVSWAAASSDNAILAALDANGTVAWWDKASGHTMKRFQHYFASNGGYLAFSPVAPLLAGSAKDGQTTVWDIRTGRIVTTIRANFRAVHGVAFSPDGQRLLSGGEDPSDVIRLLDLGSRRHVATLAGPRDQVDQFWFLEMSADLNTLVAVGIVKTALLWRAPSWEEIKEAEKREMPQR